MYLTVGVVRFRIFTHLPESGTMKQMLHSSFFWISSRSFFQTSIWKSGKGSRRSTSPIPECSKLTEMRNSDLRGVFIFISDVNNGLGLSITIIDFCRQQFRSFSDKKSKIFLKKITFENQIKFFHLKKLNFDSL